MREKAIGILNLLKFCNFAMGALYRFILCHTNTYKGHTFIENNLNYFLLETLMKCTSSMLREFECMAPECLRLMMWISHQRVTSPWGTVIASFFKKKKNKSNEFSFCFFSFFANPLFFGRRPYSQWITLTELPQRIHTLIVLSFFFISYCQKSKPGWVSSFFTISCLNDQSE